MPNVLISRPPGRDDTESQNCYGDEDDTTDGDDDDENNETTNHGDARCNEHNAGEANIVWVHRRRRPLGEIVDVCAGRVHVVRSGVVCGADDL